MKRYLALYGWPVLATAAALILRLPLDPVLGSRTPFATFYISVAVSAVLGGAIPGFIATILGALAAAYFIVQPRHSFAIAGTDSQIGLGVSVLVAMILVMLADRQRRAKLRAEEEAERRERSEAAERLERQRFEVTLGSIGDAVIATDAESRITFMNEVAARITGWAAAEALGQPIDAVFAVCNEDTGAAVENPARRAIRDGRIVGLANHTTLVSRSGAQIPIDDSGAPIVDAAGSVIGAVLVFRDVREARARESELRKRDRMVDLSHDAIILMDRERRITAWNRGARELYGWTEEEAKGRITHTLLRTRNSVAMEKVDEILRQEGRWDGELIHTCKDATEIVTESRHVLLRDSGGEIAGILEINRDITDRRRAEQELRRAAAEAEEGHRTLEAVMEHIPEGLTIAEAPDARVRMVSRHGAELAGRPREALENTTAAEHASAWGIRHSDGRTQPRPEELPLVRAVLDGETSGDEEWTIKRPDGQTAVILCKAAPIRDSEGRITGGLIAWRDISERKRLEEKLRESAKLESLGVLAGGIAHDFNNLLTGVLGNASLLADCLPQGSTAWEYARSISGAAEGAAKLSQQMLAYSGRGHFVVQSMDLSAYIRQTTPLIESAVPKHVELRLDLAENLPLVDADAAQMQQIIMNLVINGAEAISPPGGRVTVRTRAVPVDEQTIRALLLDDSVKPGMYVAVEVADTGCGMDEKTLARIFDPFFTTKFLGRGLGLAAVQGIVRGHRGAIRVQSSPGQGTTFRILFPAAAAVRSSAPEPFKAPRVDAGAGTVLVIDDEEIIRSTANHALQRVGYAVVTAADGSEGVEVFRTLKDRIAVVLLDMTMPGISGEETMYELRKIKPDIPIVLSSGFSEAEALRRFGAYGLAGFLQKPYTVKTLAERVRTAGAGR